MNVKNEWWGYVHIDGSHHVKRFFNYGDLEEAQESPFVLRVSKAFLAANREEALEILEKQIGNLR